MPVSELKIIPGLRSSQSPYYFELAHTSAISSRCMMIMMMMLSALHHRGLFFGRDNGDGEQEQDGLKYCGDVRWCSRSRECRRNACPAPPMLLKVAQAFLNTPCAS